MNRYYRKFFRTCYLKTGGFIPAKPIGYSVFPGDFFQIRNGEMIILGNVFRSGLVDPQDVSFAYNVRQNQSGWHFGDGVSKPYSGRGHGQGAIEGHFEFSKQKLAFDSAGSFFFKGNNPESIKLANWNEIQQQLILKLTQTVFSFRELYLVTETVTTSDWTLAVSGAENADLEIATEADNFGLVDIFGHHEAKTIQSHGLEYYHREATRKPAFYKAKKLVIQDERLDTFISELIEDRTRQSEWAPGFFKYDRVHEFSHEPLVPSVAKASLLDMLQANQLNPNTALLYFRWADANLDDIEKYFMNYEN
ncbi:MAG: hypothetical protein HYZ14_07330 [Bacteroidetes bacterium]|nr:hypothetical protein [Bacteroidota bacterium]